MEDGKMRKFLIFMIIFNFADAESNIRVTAIDTVPYGPFYCRARCLASCVETNLAASLDECDKFCPPFDSAMPCPPSNSDCWRNCGIPPTPRDKPPPPAVNFVTARHISSPDQRVQDPFTIELTWDPAPSASLYIVELYPLNRLPRPGENNFFRALTSYPTYMVRKEDECTVYDIRVMPVNAFGIGASQYARIEAPRPTMTGPENFFVRNIRRDPSNENFVVATIDYAVLAAWPVVDIDLVGVRVKAVECRGMKIENTSSDGAWYPFYDILIGKTPTPAMQLTFLNEVVKADCLFQMRLSALTTRCNTTTYFDSNDEKQDSAVGIDFRINCLTADGFSCEDQHPVPLFVPPPDPRSMPIPPPVPTVITSRNESVMAPILPDFAVPLVPHGQPSLQAGSINQNTHPLLIDYLKINSQPIPAICDIDTLDVQPTPSILGPSLIDLTVSWTDRNPGPYTPSYFIVRYGPVVRTLVEDARRPESILAGQEIVIRTPVSPILTGLPEKQIKVTGVPNGSLLSFQVCAIYDPNTERMISWDVVQSQRVDLLALQPDSISINGQSPKGDITSLAPLATDESPLSATPADESQLAPIKAIDVIPSSIETNDGNFMENAQHQNRDRPVFVQIGLVDGGRSVSPFWLVVLAGVTISFLTAIIFFAFLRSRSKSRSVEKKLEIGPFPETPIAVITKPQLQPMQSEKEKEALGDVEKIALP